MYPGKESFEPIRPGVIAVLILLAVVLGAADYYLGWGAVVVIFGSVFAFACVTR